MKLNITIMLTIVMLSACGGGEKSDEKKSGWTDENRKEYMKLCKDANSGYGDEISTKMCDCALQEMLAKEITFEQLNKEEGSEKMNEILMKCTEKHTPF